MNRLQLFVFRFYAFCFCAALCHTAGATTCASLVKLSLPQGRITLAVAEPAGTMTGLTDTPISDLPAFCRVEATLKPSNDSNIRIEVWMPTTSWNGKYQGTGTGGYAGAIHYPSLINGIRRGYATANSDLGTSVPSGASADALVGHPERWKDWGYRATHAMTVAAKQIIEAYYGKQASRSYFIGCSTGGQQALVEAQRFPDDYDGIIAGAPANNRTRLHMAFLWEESAAMETPESMIPLAKLQLISDAAVKACPAQKAVAADKFLSDPASCHWDPNELLCHGANAPDCLTAAQVTAVQKIYDGPKRLPMKHAQLAPLSLELYPGLTRGSELNWERVLSASGKPFMDSLFRWAFGADWNWRAFDFNQDVDAVDQALGPILNATDPKLTLFKTHGHKLVVYHGWADAMVPSLESINYLSRVEAAQAKDAAAHKRTNAEETASFYRLFMVPGMSHCGGGPGLTEIDALESLVLWTEKGIAPEKIIARRVDKEATELIRPVCPYPQTARYCGSGNVNDAMNFTCATPAANGNAH